MPQRPGPEGSGLSRPHVARASVTPAWSPGPAWGTPGRKWQLSTCSSAPETAARVLGPRAAVACDFSPGLRSVALTPGPRGGLEQPRRQGRPCRGREVRGFLGGTPVTAGTLPREVRAALGLRPAGAAGTRVGRAAGRALRAFWAVLTQASGPLPQPSSPAGAVGAGSRAQAQSRLCGHRPWAAVTSQRLLLCVRNSPSFPEGPGVGPGQPAVCPWP